GARGPGRPAVASAAEEGGSAAVESGAQLKTQTQGAPRLRRCASFRPINSRAAHLRFVPAQKRIVSSNAFGIKVGASLKTGGLNTPYFRIRVADQLPRLLTCECERSGDASKGQAFQMISGAAINDLLDAPDNRLAQLLPGGKSDHEIVDELYWTALTRPPTEKESNRATALLDQAKDKRRAL